MNKKIPQQPRGKPKSPFTFGCATICDHLRLCATYHVTTWSQTIAQPIDKTPFHFELQNYTLQTGKKKKR